MKENDKTPIIFQITGKIISFALIGAIISVVLGLFILAFKFFLIQFTTK